MYVATLSLPSGEAAIDSPSTIQAQNPATALVETDDGNIHFYLPDAPTSRQCMMVRVERQLEFEVQRAGSVRLYPYYNPDIANETTLVMAATADPLATSCPAESCGAAAGDQKGGGAFIFDLISVLLVGAASLLSSLFLCTQ
ncbi:hypothetical protein PoB_001891200 [Plakobranchus ocellatus]|uniref:Alpha-macroglobulin receptor-binding domain-containing protein n=1 Tax=Plakobranchus ocellatus TaxID=259542 RepID=A0AAV3ZD19_9GAST|nr:hypothetical protein PoB_001891200 [Plakobranchus ocellatus]